MTERKRRRGANRPIVQPHLYYTKEDLWAFGLGKKALLFAKQQGALPPYKPKYNQTHFYKGSDVLAWIAQHPVQPLPDKFRPGMDRVIRDAVRVR
jgi:hypothetical protein